MNLFSRKSASAETLLNIEGMNCGACATHVSQALQGVTGTQSVTVDLKRGQARVTGDAEATALIAAVEKAGYAATANAAS